MLYFLMKWCVSKVLNCHKVNEHRIDFNKIDIHIYSQLMVMMT